MEIHGLPLCIDHFHGVCNAHFVAFLAVLQALLSLVQAYPLYCGYLLFLSPYLLQLLSFLSPLLLSTSLFLLVLLTIFPQLENSRFRQYSPPEDPDSGENFAQEHGFLMQTGFSFLETLQKNLGGEVELLFMDALESMEAELEFSPVAPELHCSSLELGFSGCDPGVTELGFSVRVPAVPELGLFIGVPAAAVSGNSSCVPLVAEPELSVSGAVTVGTWDKNEDVLSSSFGSMRKAKEWKRTLACKLYEEKQNKWKETLGGKLIVDGFGVAEESNGEGMDLLWEAYEDDFDKTKAEGRFGVSDMKKGGKNQPKEKKKKKKLLEKVKKSTGSDSGKLGNLQSSRNEEDENGEEEEEGEVQLCCLNALRFSTGKMSFGMARPNLLKVSKALKGFGLFQHVNRPTKRGNS